MADIEEMRRVWDQWLARSRRGEVCGMLGCMKQPVVRCGHCGCWYCADHMGRLKAIEHQGEFKPI